MENGSICQIDHRQCLRHAWTERWSPKCIKKKFCVYIFFLSKENELQVTLKSTPGSRISSSMARTAADAVKSPDLKLAKLSGPKPVRSPDNKRRLEEKSTPHRPKLFPSNLSNQKLKQRVSFNIRFIKKCLRKGSCDYKLESFKT